MKTLPFLLFILGMIVFACLLGPKYPEIVSFGLIVLLVVFCKVDDYLVYRKSTKK